MDIRRSLIKQFSIHILENEHEEEDRSYKENSLDVNFDERDEIKEKNYDLSSLTHQRFGLEDYSTIINNNLLAHDDPFSWEPLQSQVAGHGLNSEMKTNDVPGVMITSEGQILKPVQESRGVQRGLTEVAFYSNVTKSNDLIDSEIRTCVPKFFGIEQFESCVDGHPTISNFLVLEDITGGFELAAVMDIKIGKQVYGPDATPEKIARANKTGWETKDAFGFKVSGVLAHSLKSEDEDVLDVDGKVYSKKSFGQKLTQDTVWKAPEAFYDSEYSGKIEIINDIFIKKLNNILKIFENQTRYHIYGSSLLFTYDANAVRKYRNGKLSSEDLEQYIHLKLIDFANVYNADGEKDLNFVSGLKNVISLFQTFSTREEPN